MSPTVARSAVDSTEARLHVDLDALAANYRFFCAAAPGREVAPAVKADAYGLGAGPVSRRLWDEGARSFFVSRLSEGESLREELGDRDARVLVLDGCAASQADRMLAARLVPVINSLEQAEVWIRAAPAQGRLETCVHIDTGMNRLGMTPEEAERLAGDAAARAALDVTLVMSHLACSPDPEHPLNARQASRFRAARDLFPAARASLASSAGVLLGEAHQFDMVRPGGSLYGCGPRGVPDPAIRPVATLLAPVLQIRTVVEGDTVGYGATFTADSPRRVALIAAGYADGVLRATRGTAFSGRRLCPMLGLVSMDVVAIDVTDDERLATGDLVELFGPNVPIDEAAAAAGTIGYELIARMGPRVKRIYV